MKSATMEREPDLSSISILTEFDDLVRNEKVLNEGSERQFLKFVNNCELNRRRWEQSEHECQRLSIELTKASHEITGRVIDGIFGTQMKTNLTSQEVHF